MLMPLLAFLQASSVPGPSATLSLFRGARVYGAGVSATYQEVSDTVLDKASPDSAHGGDYTLVGGEGHTLLIRFGGLANAIGRNARIVDATLILTSTSGDRPTLKSIGAVDRPWGEGPLKTLGIALKPGVEPPKDTSNAFAATWKARMAGVGGSSWQTPGVGGADVTPIASAVGSVAGNHLEIGGLGAVVNAMLADPGSNNGFAVTLANEAEFYSSESSIGKPELRLTLAAEENSSPGDVAVENIVASQGGFIAQLRNRGSEAVGGLRANWTVDAQSGQTVDLPGTIAPGQVLPVRFDGPVRTNGSDHRFGALSLRISSGPNDTHLADKQLTVYPAGLPISVLVARETLTALANADSARGKGAANWVQSQLDFVNEVALARSRYSFATDGCRERVRLTEIKEIGPLIDGPAPSGIGVEATFPAGSPPRLDFAFVHRLLVAIGAPDLSRAEFPLGSASVKVPGCNVGGRSPFPDLTGGGDTRYEGGIARQSLLPEIPSFDPILSAAGMEATGLLSATAVGTLNALVGVPPTNRVAAAVGAISVMPSTVLVRAYDASGAPLKHVDLAFFQSREGTVADQPAFTLPTGDSGTALLPRRPDPRARPADPFGGRNWAADGAFLVRATGPAGVGWGWLKGWQLVDAAYRGDAGFASVPLYVFMTTGSVDRSINRAAGRVVTDSAGRLPTQLAPLVDDLGKTPVQLPEKVGDWIEIDLNRDWSLAELKLTSNGQAPWRRFAIRVYQTGQKAANAVEWFSEADWSWSAQNRGAVDASGRVSVVYYGPPVQKRYNRIVCQEPGTGILQQIEAFSTRAGG